LHELRLGLRQLFPVGGWTTGIGSASFAKWYHPMVEGSPSTAMLLNAVVQ
jgi:hypothetical protein